MGGSYEAVPSYHPPSGPGVDTSPWLWISAGLAALLIGTWLLAVGGGVGGAMTALEDAPTDDSSNVAPAETPAPGTGTEPPRPGTGTDAKGVPVHVYSDVEDAVLLVNGEPHGPLAMGEGQALDLPPGAYRFEAQSHGNIAAVEVVNVKPEAPVDVFLRLPAGENGPAKQGSTPGAAPAPTAAAKAAAPTAAKPSEAAPEPAKAPTPSGAAAAPDAKAAAPGTPGPLSAPGASSHAAASPAAPVKRPKAPAPPAAAKPRAEPATTPAPAPDSPKAAPTPPPSEPKPGSPIPENPF
jgi:hypothetical protein